MTKMETNKLMTYSMDQGVTVLQAIETIDQSYNNRKIQSVHFSTVDL